MRTVVIIIEKSSPKIKPHGEICQYLSASLPKNAKTTSGTAIVKPKSKAKDTRFRFGVGFLSSFFISIINQKNR